MWFWKLFFLCLEPVHIFDGLPPGRFNQRAYRPGRTFDWTITNTSHRNVEKNTRLRIRGCSSLCRFQKGHWQCFSFYLVYETQEIKILSALTDLYFDVILLSLSYGLKLVLWGSCCNSEILQSLERLHYRAARLILNLPNDMESCQVLKQAQWCNLYFLFVSIKRTTRNFRAWTPATWKTPSAHRRATLELLDTQTSPVMGASSGNWDYWIVLGIFTFKVHLHPHALSNQKTCKVKPKDCNWHEI